jgi:type II secretory pathway pseudopilin PulG
MEQMRIKHNETGRSMVEMLGVLAIMGVLSIGGVAGYRYAVDKMNANEIINELKKRAITASQQRVLSQNINLSEYGAILGKYEVTPTNGYPEDPAFFGLEIKAVPQKVCQHIVDSDWALPAEMKIGNLIMDRDTECPNEFNDISFAFNNTLGRGDVGNGETPDVTTEATTEVRATETEVSETDEIWTDLDETEVSESDEIWTDLDETVTETETETETETVSPEISDSISEPEVSESISNPEVSVSEEEGPCPSGQFMDSYGTCRSCSDFSGSSATAEAIFISGSSADSGISRDSL